MRLVRNVLRPALAERWQAVERHLAEMPVDITACVSALDAAIARGDATATAEAARAFVRVRRNLLLQAVDAE